jgi:hypothetical protein
MILIKAVSGYVQTMTSVHSLVKYFKQVTILARDLISCCVGVPYSPTVLNPRRDESTLLESSLYNSHCPFWVRPRAMQRLSLLNTRSKVNVVYT